jgi:hypothetical protein
MTVAEGDHQRAGGALEAVGERGGGHAGLSFDGLTMLGTYKELQEWAIGKNV